MNKIMSTATAKVFIEALQSLPPNEQLGIYDWMKKHKKKFDELQKRVIPKGKKSRTNPDELYAISLQSFADDWDAPENEHWDKLYKKQQG